MQQLLVYSEELRTGSMPGTSSTCPYSLPHRPEPCMGHRNHQKSSQPPVYDSASLPHTCTSLYRPQRGPVGQATHQQLIWLIIHTLAPHNVCACIPSLPLLQRCASEARQPKECQSQYGAYRGVAGMTANTLEDGIRTGSSSGVILLRSGHGSQRIDRRAHMLKIIGAC